MADGATSLYNAIYVSLKELSKVASADAGRPRRQAIVLLSDGEDTYSVMQMDDVLDLAYRSDTTIYSVGLGARPANGRPAKFGGRIRVAPPGEPE